MKRIERSLCRIALAAAAALLFPTAASCRILPIEWGFLAGFNVPGYSTGQAGADLKNRLGWQVGVVSSIKLGLISIDPQLIYVHQGLRLDAGGERYTLKAGFVDLPVTVSLRPAPVLRLYAGPVFTLSDNCRRKSGGDLHAFDRVRTTLSYTAGVAIKPLPHFFFDVRYNGQFKRRKHLDLGNGAELHDLQTHSIAISVGYLF